MTISMDDFIAELRQMVKHWNKEFSQLDNGRGGRLAGQIGAWLAEAERIIAIHDGKDV